MEHLLALSTQRWSASGDRTSVMSCRTNHIAVVQGCFHVSWRLWVPKTPSASCGERVFVDDAADPVAAVDADGVEVGNRCWQGLEGCCLIEGAVRLVGVVVGLILTKGLAVGAAGSRSTSGRGVRVGSCRSSVP